MAASPLAVAHRAQQVALRAVVLRELRRVWPSLDPERLDETFPGWVAAVAPLVASSRRASAALAARYVRALRASAGVPGAAPVVAVGELPPEVLLSSLGVTGPVAIKKAMTRGVPLEDAARNAFVLSAAAVSRHVLDAGRETILASARSDDRVEGWRRVTSPRACEFCDSLDDIYPPGSGDFKSHDGCACTVEPVYT